MLGGRQPREAFDQGLQQERTVLSWERTAFSLIAVGALLFRAVDQPDAHVGWLVVSCVPLVTSAVLLVAAPHRNRSLHARLREGADIRANWTVRLTSLAVMGAAAVAVGMVLRSMFPLG